LTPPLRDLKLKLGKIINQSAGVYVIVFLVFVPIGHMI